VSNYAHEEYANPDALAAPKAVEERLNDPDVTVVEVSVDTEAYDRGHVPGAVHWNWTTDLTDDVQRDIPTAEDFQTLLAESGIDRNTTVILYGDNNNWFAAFAYWLLNYYGHDDVQLLDGGRKRWLLDGRPLTLEVPDPEPTGYTVTETRPEIRATREDVLEALEDGDATFVDVRSPEEFTGEIVAPPDLDETAQRGGHIPGALNISWSEAVDEDGTFHTRKELEGVYRNVDETETVVDYCRIGERSSFSWFVHSELLGYDDVRNYDGSWTEWGNLVGAPIETGATSADTTA
jgi:thiosulfate/3-mercaptopyruvate sulfurtransferase